MLHATNIQSPSIFQDMVLRKTLNHLYRKTQMATHACRETCFTAYPVLRVGFMPECVVCCIQVAYATNRTSTENWLQLRQLERKEFSALGLINPNGRIGANLISSPGNGSIV